MKKKSGNKGKEARLEAMEEMSRLRLKPKGVEKRGRGCC